MEARDWTALLCSGTRRQPQIFDEIVDVLGLLRSFLAFRRRSLDVLFSVVEQ